MDFDDLISLVLRAGVTLSAILIFTGMLLLFVGRGGIDIQQLAYGTSLNSSGLGAAQIMQSVASLDWLGFIMLGIVALIATPVARVVLSVMSFIGRRNWTYVAITAIVLLDLLFAIFVVPGLIAH